MASQGWENMNKGKEQFYKQLQVDKNTRKMISAYKELVRKVMRGEK